MSISKETKVFIISALHYLHDTMEHGLEEDPEELKYWKDKSLALAEELKKDN